MTAEEIRAKKFECDAGTWECAEWLREIAAQLAEINCYLNSKPAPAPARPATAPTPSAKPSGTAAAAAVLSPPAKTTVPAGKYVMSEKLPDTYEQRTLRPMSTANKLASTKNGQVAYQTMRAQDETGQWVSASIWDAKLFPYVANRLKQKTTFFLSRSKDGKFLTVVGLEA